MVSQNVQRQHPLRPDEFGTLYPTPKTYDDIQKATDERQKRFEQLRTHFPALKVSFFGTVLFTAIFYYLRDIQPIQIAISVPLRIVSYAVWVFIVLLAIKWLRYAGRVCYEYSGTFSIFVICYVLGMGGGIIAWRLGVGIETNSQVWLPILAGINAAVTYLGMKLCLTGTSTRAE